VLQLSPVLCSLLYERAGSFVAAFDYDYDEEKEVEEGQKSFKILQKNSTTGIGIFSSSW
jgi:hypothetical protein